MYIACIYLSYVKYGIHTISFLMIMLISYRYSSYIIKLLNLKKTIVYLPIIPAEPAAKLDAEHKLRE